MLALLVRFVFMTGIAVDRVTSAQMVTNESWLAVDSVTFDSCPSTTTELMKANSNNSHFLSEWKIFDFITGVIGRAR